MRHSYQSGSVIRVHAQSGDYWRFRFRDGKTHRSEYIGSLTEFPTKAQAEKAAERFRAQANQVTEVITVADLVAKFWQEAAPERETTAHSYRSIFKRVESDFGSLRLDEFARNPLAIEKWLKELKVIGRHPVKGPARLVSPLYRGQVRNLLHLLMQKAILWNHLHLQRNPMEMIRLKDSSKRKKDLVILTLEQYHALLEDEGLPLLVKTMIQIAAGLGLRVSEVLGLKWADLDFEQKTIRIRRSVVHGEANETKTASSATQLPLHENLIAVLQMWRMTAPAVNGWVFGSERTGKPYDRDSLREEYLQTAGERIGVQGLGWHSMRHLYRALLRQGNAPLEAQKNLMRHAKLSTTMDVYGGKNNVDALRPANSNVVEMLQRRSA